MRIARDITELIGNTPLVELGVISKGLGIRLLAKLEFFNPGGSVKDRISLSLIEDAEKKGIISPGSVIIEPSSGNTGIGLALVCARRGYRLIITMPESMSRERIKLLGGLGAEVVLTPAHLGMDGAIAKARELGVKNRHSFIPQQFDNPANPEAHRMTTAEEIWRDTEGNIDAIVAGIGTGGTLTGVAAVLKKKKTTMLAVGVEPKDSNVLSGGKPGPHQIQGIGAGFVPSVLDLGLVDEVIQVSNGEAYRMTRRIMREEGILCGLSSGAAAQAALQLMRRFEGSGNTCVVIFPDGSERYMSTKLFDS